MISENLASGSLPGFKKSDMVLSALPAGIIRTFGSALNDATRWQLPLPLAAVNFSPGQIRPTGVATDVAIEGRGFFEVQLPGGETAYTRDGEFHLNSLGQLTTKAGYLVLGDGGPIQIDRNHPAPISISESGEVSQGQEVRARLRVVDFDRHHLLQPAGAGCFTARSDLLQPVPVEAPRLRQGALEGANVSPMMEMASLIAVMRHFEAAQKVIQAQDERMGRSIQELGNPS
jgi:flagellar basal-body rod protein FlgF